VFLEKLVVASASFSFSFSFSFFPGLQHSAPPIVIMRLPHS